MINVRLDWAKNEKMQGVYYLREECREIIHKDKRCERSLSMLSMFTRIFSTDIMSLLVFLPWIDIMFTIPLGPIYRQKESLETSETR